MKVRGAMSVGPVVLLLLATVGCCCCVGAAPAAGDTPVGGDVPCDWTAFSTHMTQMGRSCCEAGASCDRSGMPLGDGCPAECGAAVSRLLSHCASFVAENMPVQHEQLERLQRRCEHAHRLAKAHGGDGSGGTACDCSAAALSALKKSTVMKGLDARVARLESAAAPQKHTSNGGTAGVDGGGGQCADLEARLEKLEKTRQLLTPPADAAPVVTSGATAMPDEMLRLREKVARLEERERASAESIQTLQQHMQELLFGMGLVQVKVPHGAEPGQQLKVRVPRGRVVAITVPDGALAGDIIRSRLPDSFTRSANES